MKLHEKIERCLQRRKKLCSLKALHIHKMNQGLAEFPAPIPVQVQKCGSHGSFQLQIFFADAFRINLCFPVSDKIGTTDLNKLTLTYAADQLVDFRRKDTVI